MEKINRPNTADQLSNPGSGQTRFGDQRFDKLIAEVEDYAIILLDTIGTIVSWNKGVEKIKGYTPAEAIGRSFRIFYCREDKESGLPDLLLQRAMTEGKANHEGWRIRKDGNRFWANVVLSAVHNDDGSVSGFLEVTRDLSERKLTEDKHSNYTEQLRLKNEELKHSKERYQRMVSEVHDYAIILLDTQGKILDWNKGAEFLKGYAAKEIIGKNFRLFYPAEDKDSNVPEKLLEEAAAKGSVKTEGWRIKKDGTRFWGNVTITALHDDSGAVIGFSKVTQDLTEHKIAMDRLNNFTDELKHRNEELRQSEERYHRMIAEVQDYAIILLDEQGIIQNWNTGAELLKGYAPQEIIGKSFRKFYSAKDNEAGLPQSLLEQARSNGKAAHEGWRIRKDGTRFWGSIFITALHNDESEVVGFSKVTRDLTARKLADDKIWSATVELQAKNRMLEGLNAELSAYAYVVSHDLKEPVRKIRLFAERQQESGQSLEKILTFSGSIARSAERMQQLMADLLKYSELSGQAQNAPVDLNQILEGVKIDLELPINETEATIHAENLPVINVISVQVNQVFTNIIMNSLKFARNEEKPVINISYRQVKGSTIFADLETPDKMFHEISLADNGIGFDQKNAEKIFLVFGRLQSKEEAVGSGIGLAIVKKVMLNHGGTVTVESAPQKGSTFRLYFPM